MAKSKITEKKKIQSRVGYVCYEDRKRDPCRVVDQKRTSVSSELYTYPRAR